MIQFQIKRKSISPLTRYGVRNKPVGWLEMKKCGGNATSLTFKICDNLHDEMFNKLMNFITKELSSYKYTLTTEPISQTTKKVSKTHRIKKGD